MSYHALYRKYRPSSLSDVVGQKSIVKIIKNSLLEGRISHAYMFSGPRGTGKTTMAKILAQNVNCLSPIDGLACGKCKNCLSIIEHSTSDIIEIDAASNNGVDEIREIRNKISLVPSELLYKVYIIDEVHMLSTGAFNALLKTLEEPPEHIIFVLATTDLHKVPSTIISRCQCFEFKRLSENEIFERLSYISKNENIIIDDDVLKAIANLADGGMRDAIGMLDKVASYSTSKITMVEFEELNGIVSKTEKINFLHYIENKDVSKIINFIDLIYNQGKDLLIFSQDLLLLCRDYIVSYYMSESIDFDIQFLLKFVDNFSNLPSAIRFASNIRIAFEIKMLSFLNLITDVSCSSNDIINDSKNSISNTENSISDSFNDQNTTNISSNDGLNHILEVNNLVINNCFAMADKNILKNIKENWKLFDNYALDSQYGAVACYIADGVVRAASPNEIIITFDYESMVDRGYKIIDNVELLFNKIFSGNYKIAIITTDKWNQLKKEYIENKNKGITYEYCTIPDTSDKIISADNDVLLSSSTVSTVKDKAVQMFGNDVVING